MQCATLSSHCFGACHFFVHASHLVHVTDQWCWHALQAGVDYATAMYADEEDEDEVPMPSIDDDTVHSEVDDDNTDVCIASTVQAQSAENRATSSYDVPVAAINAAISALEPTHRALLELMASDLDMLRPPRVPRSQQGG
jgi:hypothetical protein